MRLKKYLLPVILTAVLLAQVSFGLSASCVPPMDNGIQQANFEDVPKLKPIVRLYPDLAANVVAPATANLGDSASITIATRNLGKAASQPSATSWKVRGMAVNASGTIQVPSLAAGGSFENEVQFSCAREGNATITVSVDSGNASLEANECNNLREVRVKCIEPDKVDLVPEMPSHSWVYVGDDWTAAENAPIYAVNQGYRKTAGAFSVGYSWGGGRPPVYREIRQPIAYTWYTFVGGAFVCTAPGTYQVNVTVDVYNEVNEANEGNNRRTFQIECRTPQYVRLGVETSVGAIGKINGSVFATGVPYGSDVATPINITGYVEGYGPPDYIFDRWEVVSYDWLIDINPVAYDLFRAINPDCLVGDPYSLNTVVFMGSNTCFVRPFTKAVNKYVDLEIDEIQLRTSRFPDHETGEFYTLLAAVSNTGTISSNATALDRYIDGVFVGRETVAPVAGRADFSGRQNFTYFDIGPPPYGAVCPSGGNAHIFKAVIDADNRNAESNESNNVATLNFSC